MQTRRVTKQRKYQLDIMLSCNKETENGSDLKNKDDNDGNRKSKFTVTHANNDGNFLFEHFLRIGIFSHPDTFAHDKAVFS